MRSHEAAGLLFLAVLTACGARTPLSAGNGTGGSTTSSTSSCTPITIDPKASVSSLIAEGERIYYLATEGRVMSADATTGATTLLAQIPQQPIGPLVALATDADSLYVSFDPGLTGAFDLWRVSKAGGVPEQIALGKITNAFLDATGLYWTDFLVPQTQTEVFRRRPDGTTLSLGVIDETYDTLPGLYRGTAGLLVANEAALFALDIEGAGTTTLVDQVGVSFPFERDGALFYNVASFSLNGFFRAKIDATMPEQLYQGPFGRGVTDGVSWVFVTEAEKGVSGASYPHGEISLVYQSPVPLSARAVALTPTRLVLGAAFPIFEAGIQSLCRDALGL